MSRIDPHRDAIAVALTMAAEYYRQVVPPLTLRTMVDDLAEFGIEDIKRALVLHRKDPERGRFFPLTADLTPYLSSTPEDSARAAWDRALEAARRHGKWTAVSFDDVRITACIEAMGGWVRLCSLTIDEMPFRQRDFVERYARMVRTGEGAQYARRTLTGLNTDGRITYVGDPPEGALPAPDNVVNMDNLRRLTQLVSNVAGEAQPK